MGGAGGGIVSDYESGAGGRLEAAGGHGGGADCHSGRFLCAAAPEHLGGAKYLRSAEARTRYETAKAIFDERCKQAGEKIYRTTSGVEGITLLNIYPRKPNIEGSYNPDRDPMWADATLIEAWGG